MFIYDDGGIDCEKLRWMMEIKNQRGGRISEYADEFGAQYHEGKRASSVPCDLASEDEYVRV